MHNTANVENSLANEVQLQLQLGYMSQLGHASLTMKLAIMAIQTMQGWSSS